MPFKTRRRKQSAAERRFTWNQNQAVRYVQMVGQTATDSSHESLGKTKVSDNKRITETVNTSRDLVKIILAACSIIALQVVFSLLRK